MSSCSSIHDRHEQSFVKSGTYLLEEDGAKLLKMIDRVIKYKKQNDPDGFKYEQ